MSKLARRFGTLAMRVLAYLCAVLLCHGCKPEVKPNADAITFHRMILAFVSASASGDTATLSDMALDENAMADAHRLREFHSETLRAPEERFGVPHYVTIRGDTAVAMLFVREDGRQEFGAEFRRMGRQWRIARIGFSPK